MAIDINGVGLPDIPTDVLASYPYATIFHVRTIGSETEGYLLVTANTSFGHCEPGVITGVSYEVVGSFGAGMAYTASSGATEWANGTNRPAGENLVAVGTATTDSGITTCALVWSNHNIFEITSVNTDTGEHTNGGIWFAKSVDGSGDESLVATHCYYNGVFLPVIPSEVLANYPYCWIRNNTQTGYYDLFLSSSPWWMTDTITVSTANYAEGIQWYRISIYNPGDEWEFNQSWTENGDFTADLNRPFLWSNHNIPTGSVTGSEIYYTGSSPVPVVESYEISRNRLSGLANQVRRLCGTTETLTPERMETRMTGLNIELQEARVCSSDQVQTILPDKGYYGFSSIIVEALDISGGTGGGTGGDGTGDGETGGDTGAEYPSLEDSALTYEATTAEVPTGRYFYGTYSKSLPACPVTYPYQYLYISGGVTMYQTNVAMYDDKTGNLRSPGIYSRILYTYDSTTDTWVTGSHNTNIPKSWTIPYKTNYAAWSNYDICDSSGNLRQAAREMKPETVVTETYAPAGTDAFYTIKGDTVTSLGATVYQITGQQATTPDEMIAALNYYAALNKQTAEEETTE